MNYNQFYQPYNPYQYVQQQQQQQQISYPTINGKIIENAETLRVTEIPLGGYGIFPLADMSSVFIKSYQNDGSTQTVKYDRVVDSPNIDVNLGEKLQQIGDSIVALEEKIDELNGKKTTPPSQRRKKVGSDE